MLTLVRAAPEPTDPVDPAAVSVESGLADVVTLQRRRQTRISVQDEESFFLDTLSEYQWARDAAGLAPTTLDGLIKPVVEVCEFYGTVPWKLSSREVDRYFAGAGKRAQSTLRAKINKIDAYFAFLEQRYAGEIMRCFGHAVESPIDLFNRPGTAATSACGSRPRRPRCGSSSAAGARTCPAPESTWSPAVTT